MNYLSAVAFALAAALAAAPQPSVAAGADAHGKAGGHDVKPQYGGAVVEVQEVAYELVLKPDGAVIYVSDHGKPLATQGAKATLTLLTGAQKVDVALTPAGTNELRGAADLKAMSGAKAVAMVTLAGKKPVTVRFSTK